MCIYINTADTQKTDRQDRQMKAARRAGTLRNYKLKRRYDDVMRTDDAMMRAADDSMRADYDMMI